MDQQQTRRAALGQRYPIGTYYNARTDTFVQANLLQSNLPAEAIQVAEINETNVKPGYDDTYEKQFEAMDISAGLGLSLLSRFTQPRGSSVYLQERNNGRVLQAALHHTITTVREAVNFSFAGLRDCLASSEVSSNEATHVVAQIEWGARSVIAARHHVGRTTKVEVAKSDFQTDFVTFMSAVEALKLTDPENNGRTTIEQRQAQVEITAFSDILEGGGVLMESFQEAFEFLQLVRLDINNENSGKGLPITYLLLPIEILGFLLPTLKISSNTRFVTPPADCLNPFIRLFNEFQICQRNLDRHEKKVQDNARYLPPNSLRLIEQRQMRRQAAEEDLRSNLARTLNAVRGGADAASLRTLLARYRQGDLSPGYIANVGDSHQKKIDFISKAVAQGAHYVGYDGSSLENILPKRPGSEAYVLYFTSAAMSDHSTWPANHDLLFEMLKKRDPNKLFAIVDCEATSEPLQNVHIASFEDGQQISDNYLEYKLYMADKCFAAYAEETLETKDIQKPIERRHVKIPCPGPQCNREDREWICPRCVESVEYGFSDQYIYCGCGRSLYTNYTFNCNSDLHGSQLMSYNRDRLLKLLQSLIQSNYLNVLVLGETGVGKSTFINALVNYLEFETLDEAISAEQLNYVIPCSFATQIMHRDNPNQPIEEKKIRVGARQDEQDGSTGNSATQQTQVYPVTFHTSDTTLTVRLIDTPGMGDTRGVDADKQNMADILSTLSGYEELHGILILLKSNSARLTISFSYCIKELLTHLHQNAARNMAFGFTNTRISNYTPGDTYGPLTSLLAQHPDMGLTLSTPTTYCFDSESFRYLAAYKNGVIMENKLDFDRSWKHSREESIRLINYFKSNPPHKVKNTISLNGARQVIAELTKPMAEISQVIRTNIAMAEDKMRDLQDHRLTGDQLRNQLHVQKVQLNAVQLDKPRTVCTKASCTEVKDDGKGQNQKVVIYKTHCHPACYLDGVKADEVAHPGLINCAAFMGSDHCTVCQHHWQEHLHVLVELHDETVTVVDSAIQQQLQNHANDTTLRETALKQQKQLSEEYKKEREIIRDAAAKFGVFLRKNSLAAYNDSLVAYLDHLIKEEQMKVQNGGSDQRLLSLTEERHKHKEAIEIIMQNINSNVKPTDVSEVAVDRLVKQLYNLKHFGTNLKNLQSGIAKAHQATYREIPYVVQRGRRGVQYPYMRKLVPQTQQPLSNQSLRVARTASGRGVLKKPHNAPAKPGVLTSMFRKVF